MAALRAVTNILNIVEKLDMVGVDKSPKHLQLGLLSQTVIIPGLLNVHLVCCFFPHPIGNNSTSKKITISQENMLCKFLRMSNDMPSPNAAEATVSTCENKLDELYRQTVAMVSFTQRVKPEKQCVFSYL